MKKVYKILSLIVCLGAVLASYGQAEQKKSYFMDYPLGTGPAISKAPPSCAQTLNYDGDNITRFGFGTGEWSAMIFIDQSDLAFFEDTSTFVGARIFIDSTTDLAEPAYDSIYLELYEGSEVTVGGNLIIGDSALYSKNVTSDITILGWNEIYFDSSLAINRDTTYLLRVKIFQSVANGSGGFPMGAGEGPMVRDRGAWWEDGGDIGQLGDINPDYDYNWNIRLCVEGGKIIPQYNLTAANPGSEFSPYKVIPLKQASFQGFNITGTIENNGSVSIPSATATYNVVPNNATADEEVTNINAFNEKPVTFTTPFVPFDTGFYAIELSVDMDSTDFYPPDNMVATKAFYVDESRYSSVFTANTGFQPQNGFTDVTFGNLFNMYTPDTIKQMEILVRGTSPGASFYGYIAKWDELQFNVFGDTIRTDTITSFAGMPDDQDSVFYLHFRRHEILDEGVYMVGLVEIEGGLSSGILGSNTDYIEGRSFVTAAERPNWIPSDQFWTGGGYYYGITINFGTFPETVGVEEELSKDFQLYPNPAENKVTVALGNNSNLSNLSLELLDLTGRTIKSKENISYANNVEIELDEMMSGVYMVKLSNGTQNYVKKLIVK